MIELLTIIGIIAIIYSYPIIKLLISTKKVKLTFIDKNGNKNSTTIRLEKADDIWDLIRENKKWVDQ